jgi:phosphoribulokinase
MPLPSLSISLDLAAMLELDKPAFLLATVPFRYWGRTAIAVHIDGNLAPQTIRGLEQYIVGRTGIPLLEAVPQESYEKVSATYFSQLLIAWRFLSQVQQILG